MSSSKNENHNNLTLMKSTLKSEIQNLITERDNVVKQNNKKFTLLKDFDNYIYNTILNSRNSFLDLFKNQEFDNNILLSLEDKVKNKISSRNDLIRDIMNEVKNLDGIINTIKEFRKIYIDEIKDVIKNNSEDKSIPDKEWNKLAVEIFKKTFEDVLKVRSKKDFDEINSSFKKRYRTPSPSKSPTKQSAKSPTKQSTKSPKKSPKKQSKKVKIDETKNTRFAIPPS